MKERKRMRASAHIASLVVIAALLSASAARGHDDDDHYDHYDSRHHCGEPLVGRDVIRDVHVIGVCI